MLASVLSHTIVKHFGDVQFEVCLNIHYGVCSTCLSRGICLASGERSVGLERSGLWKGGEMRNSGWTF